MGRLHVVLLGVSLLGAVGPGAVGLDAQKAKAKPKVAAKPATDPNWETDLQRRHDELVKRNGPGTDAALRDKLLEMRARDQAARGFVNGEPVNKDKVEMAANLGEIDKGITEELKVVIAERGWPTISMVGIEASNGAMLILTHSRDHAWQRSLLGQLEVLADSGKIDGAGLAMMIDKELVSEGKLQRYGTQFKFVGTYAAMYGVEDPAGLDARRARVFLPPMGPYKQMLGEMYHLPVSDKIVSAAAMPAASKPRK